MVMHRLLFFIVGLIVAWWVVDGDDELVVLPDGAYRYEGYRIQNGETFNIEARVLSRRDYRFGREAELSPTDLAIGWGEMAEDEVLDRIEVSQGNRWYYWHSDEFVLSPADVHRQSANVHIVPGNAVVAAALEDVSVDDRIRLSGQLVDIHGEDGWRWLSSRSRTDRGNGSCELLLLDNVQWL